jgi:His-Xaa-Ser system protein HxsD
MATDSDGLGRAVDVAVRADLRIYGEEAVLKAAHRFGDRCHVHLERHENAIVCRLRPKRPLENLDSLAGEFSNELADQSLRARLLEQTAAVRNLLLAQAFSGLNLIRPELDDEHAAEG